MDDLYQRNEAEGRIYACTSCGKYDEETQSCETCDNMACRVCLESDYWSSKPMMCAGCQDGRLAELQEISEQR